MGFLASYTRYFCLPLKLVFLAEQPGTIPGLCLKNMDLVFATHNPNKIKEVQPLLPPFIRLITLDSLGCDTDIPETGATLKENALLKARYVQERYGMPCFADDTGLLVSALDGAPGVHSARYAGVQKNADDNMNKLLGALQANDDRDAYFETVIALVLGGETKFFSGRVNGSISRERSGDHGFGYDPIFIPEGYSKSFASLSLQEKNLISHRARALRKLIGYLGQLQPDKWQG